VCDEKSQDRRSDPHLIELGGIRDAMPADPYAKTHYRAEKQADEDMRRDEPWLWLFANVVTWAIHPWVSLRLCWSRVVARRLGCYGLEIKVKTRICSPRKEPSS